MRSEGALTVHLIADLSLPCPAWEELLNDNPLPETRLFLSPEWVTMWWRYFGRGKAFLLTVTDRERWLSMAPLFCAPSPLMPTARVLRFIGTGHADYGDFLIRRGCEEAAAMLWRWLFAHRALWDVIAFHELPQDSIAFRTLAQVSLPQWAQVQVLRGEPCHRIPLNTGDGTGWRARATNALREQLKRRERQIARLFDARFQRATEPAEVAAGMAHLFALHRLRWGQRWQPGVLWAPKVQRFHREFALQALQQGRLRLHSLTLNGVPAAVYYAFHCGDYAGFYACGFHPAFGRYSVGKVLLAKVIDEAEQEGAKVFDFMRGGESYKAEFGTVVAHNFHLFVWQNDKLRSTVAARLHRLTTFGALRLKSALQR
ncbi:hypothetical protein HRbin17_02216 [bacterium HR17]|uniref:BioF2-like acetyltransferase domain-containing protein n=1 Tax=Candidatus Fervidibacter japonicus TaxID=2035412 RepID=A0A2H5XES9_9BACT|nr:hypothetical protein HRbin17_02216 [bacterium HR17]